MSETSQNEFVSTNASVPMLTLSESGKLPPSRMKDADSLRTAHNRFREDDLISARDRSEMQEWLDGATPWDQNEMRDAGLSNNTNINWGGAEEELEWKMNPYWERLTQQDTLVAVQTMWGENEARAEWNNIIADEITRTIRSWPEFAANTLRLCKHFLWEGLGIAYFDNWLDWRFSVGRKGEFFFPRQVLLSEESCEIVTALKRFNAVDLYRQIENEKIAKQLGWNPALVKKAIHRAGTGQPGYQDWEYLADQLKNGDYSFSTNLQEIRVILGLWKEFDGTITLGMCLDNPLTDGGSKEWLFLKRGQYASMSRAMVLFPYGIGTNAKTHGTRGIGFQLYNKDVCRSESLCLMADACKRSMMLMLKATDEKVLNELAMQVMGMYTLINPEVDVVTNPMPNLADGVVPWLREMDMRISRRMGTLAGGNAFSGERKTKFEAEALIGQQQKISTIHETFFDVPAQRLFREQIRRMTRRNYQSSEPGGEYIVELRKRILAAGVPLEAFHNLDHERTTMLTPIGSGSLAEKMQVLDRLNTLRGELDEVGQRNLTRDNVVTIIGSPSLADRYAPRDTVKRTPPDTKIAMLENPQLEAGQQIPVLDGEMNSIHAEVHIKRLEEIWQSYMQGGMPIEQYATVGRGLHDHAADHVERMAGDMGVEVQAGQFRQRIQQLGEDIANGLKAIAAAQRKAEEEAAQGGGQQPAPQGPTPEQEQRFYEWQARMQMKSQEAEQRLAIREKEAAQRMAIKDMEAAAAIRRKGRTV